MSTQNAEIDLRRVLDLLRRRARLIIVTMLATLALATLVTVSLKPVYSASALVLVDPTSKNLLAPDSQATSGSSDSARVDSEAAIVVSDSNLLEVIKELNLVSDPELGVRLGLADTILAWLRMGDAQLPTGDEALADVLASLHKAVKAERNGLTFLIEVSARSRDKAKAAQLANTVAKVYVRRQIDAKINSTLEARDVLRARLSDASAAVVKTENAFDDFLSRNMETIISSTGRQDIADLRQRLVATETERTRLTGLADLVSRSSADKQWTSLASALGSDALKALEAQRQQVLGDIARNAPDAPAAVDLRKQLAQIEENLSKASSRELSSLQGEITTARGRESDLRDNLRRSVLASDLPTDVLAQIYEIQQSSEVARAQYQTLLVRLNDLETQSALQVADSRIVSDALVPDKPSFPNVPLMLAVTALGAVGLGVLVALLYENYVGGFTSDRQLEAVLKVKTIAVVPRVRTVRDDTTDGSADTPANALLDAPMSAYAEAMRSARVALDQIIRRRPTADGGTIVMVSSAVPNEGKSSVALSLARAYAISGRKTLLMDCDLRRPSLARLLKLDPRVTLADLLSADVSSDNLEAAVQQDPRTPLQVLLSARRPAPRTDHLVAETSFAPLLADARRSFDVIILDTPPIIPVADGRWIAELADIVVLVVKWSATLQQDAHRALDLVEAAKGHDVEVVALLNQTDGSTAGERKYSGYYQAY
jgi:capsular exopolysaccharide synthesis family protein